MHISAEPKKTGQKGAIRSKVPKAPVFFDKGKEAILSIAQAAEILGCHKKTLERRIRLGLFPHRKVPREKRDEIVVFLSELVAWLDRRKGVKLRCK